MPKVAPTGMGLRMFRKESTLEMGRRRMKWLFDEFEGRIMVNVSGGKDSLVMFELALEAARAGGYLPVATYWLDQEAEWQSVVDLVEEWMTRPEVDPWWLQCPFRIFNATSTTAHWLTAWYPEDRELFMHPQHPVAITENTFGTDRFYELFAAVLDAKFGKDKPCAGISGVRAEEARTRFMGATQSAKYKWLTWGGGLQDSRYPNQHVFWPLYDWTYLDVWKCIHEHQWPYAKVYDDMWQRGLHPLSMRVSNLHHEHAVGELFILQEVEPDTYERLIRRIEGVHMAATLGAQYFPQELPFMFGSWGEYRDHLLDTMIDPDHQAYMAHMFRVMDRRTPADWRDFVWRAQCRTIVLNDVEGKSLMHAANNQALKRAQQSYVRRMGGAGMLEPLPPAPPRPKLPYS